MDIDDILGDVARVADKEKRDRQFQDKVTAYRERYNPLSAEQNALMSGYAEQRRRAEYAIVDVKTNFDPLKSLEKAKDDPRVIDAEALCAALKPY